MQKEEGSHENQGYKYSPNKLVHHSYIWNLPKLYVLSIILIVLQLSNGASFKTSPWSFYLV
jgi:hypothetical protein